MRDFCAGGDSSSRAAKSRASHHSPHPHQPGHHHHHKLLQQHSGRPALTPRASLLTPTPSSGAITTTPSSVATSSTSAVSNSGSSSTSVTSTRVTNSLSGVTAIPAPTRSVPFNSPLVTTKPALPSSTDISIITQASKPEHNCNRTGDSAAGHTNKHHSPVAETTHSNALFKHQQQYSNRAKSPILSKFASSAPIACKLPQCTTLTTTSPPFSKHNLTTLTNTSCFTTISPPTRNISPRRGSITSSFSSPGITSSRGALVLGSSVNNTVSSTTTSLISPLTRLPSSTTLTTTCAPVSRLSTFCPPTLAPSKHVQGRTPISLGSSSNGSSGGNNGRNCGGNSQLLSLPSSTNIVLSNKNTSISVVNKSPFASTNSTTATTTSAYSSSSLLLLRNPVIASTNTNSTSTSNDTLTTSSLNTIACTVSSHFSSVKKRVHSSLEVTRTCVQGNNFDKNTNNFDKTTNPAPTYENSDITTTTNSRSSSITSVVPVSGNHRTLLDVPASVESVSSRSSAAQRFLPDQPGDKCSLRDSKTTPTSSASQLYYYSEKSSNASDLIEIIESDGEVSKDCITSNDKKISIGDNNGASDENNLERSVPESSAVVGIDTSSPDSSKTADNCNIFEVSNSRSAVISNSRHINNSNRSTTDTSSVSNNNLKLIDTAAGLLSNNKHVSVLLPSYSNDNTSSSKSSGLLFRNNANNRVVPGAATGGNNNRGENSSSSGGDSSNSGSCNSGVNNNGGSNTSSVVAGVSGRAVSITATSGPAPHVPSRPASPPSVSITAVLRPHHLSSQPHHHHHHHHHHNNHPQTQQLLHSSSCSNSSNSATQSAHHHAPPTTLSTAASSSSPPNSSHHSQQHHFPPSGGSSLHHHYQQQQHHNLHQRMDDGSSDSGVSVTEPRSVSRSSVLSDERSSSAEVKPNTPTPQHSHKQGVASSQGGPLPGLGATLGGPLGSHSGGGIPNFALDHRNNREVRLWRDPAHLSQTEQAVRHIQSLHAMSYPPHAPPLPHPPPPHHPPSHASSASAHSVAAVAAAAAAAGLPPGLGYPHGHAMHLSALQPPLSAAAAAFYGPGGSVWKQLAGVPPALHPPYHGLLPHASSAAATHEEILRELERRDQDRVMR